MPETIERLGRRSDTLQSIHGIVRTMKTMSAINALPYEKAAQSIDAYHATILDGLRAFVRRNGPLAQAPEPVGTHVTVVFGSDHGLCGNYNEVLAETVMDHVKPLRSGRTPLRVLCIGTRMANVLSGLDIAPDRTLLTPASTDGIGQLAGEVVVQVDAIGQEIPRTNTAVTLAYTQPASQGRRETRCQALLPLDDSLIADLNNRPWQSRSLPDFTVPPSALLAALIRNYLFASVFRAAAEALVTENAARFALMQQAEQSVQDRLEETKSEMRTARQTAITTELSDVISGFEALQRKKPG